METKVLVNKTSVETALTLMKQQVMCIGDPQQVVTWNLLLAAINDFSSSMLSMPQTAPTLEQHQSQD